MAKVILMDYSYREVTEEQVEVLLQKRKLIGFQRSGLWIAAKHDEGYSRGGSRQTRDTAADESGSLMSGGPMRRNRKPSRS